MPNTNTTIQFKRSDSTKEVLAEETLQYGEPLFFEQENGKHKYLAIGNGTDGIDTATFFAGITNADLLDKTVYANDELSAVLADGTPVGVSKVTPSLATISRDDNVSKYYLLSYNNNITDKNVFYHGENRGIYITGNGVLCGAAWNDYAERRLCEDIVKPGNVVCETGNGHVALSKEKLQPIPHVVSDTYGMIIGDNPGIPVSVAGRALVYVDCEVSLGDVLCARENGIATKMTRQEIVNYPDRILGIVSEIPTYEVWNGVTIDGRVWIAIK